MLNLQNLIEQHLQKELPRNALQRFILKRLVESGIEPDSSLAFQITDHFISGSEEPFRWDDGTECDKKISFSFTDSDLAEIDRNYAELVESLPDVWERTSDGAAKILLRSLKRRWRSEFSLQSEELAQFRDSLEARWAKPLGLLRMLLTCSREMGEAVANVNLSGKSSLPTVLSRLHIRACQVTSEIIVLLENGYADGAMARWRTLHEISVVMLVLKEYGEAITERYLDHRAVEAKNGKDQYAKCHKDLGYKAMGAGESRAIEKRYERVIKKYGESFRHPYGWAAGYVGGTSKRVSWSDLEEVADRSFMRSHYKLASYNVHAGPHALFFRLGLIEDSGFLAGCSNAGLSEPGQNTAVTFTLISSILMGDSPSFDDQVSMKTMELLMDEIPMAFAKAENKLKRDHFRVKKDAMALDSA